METIGPPGVETVILSIAAAKISNAFAKCKDFDNDEVVNKVKYVPIMKP